MSRTTFTLGELAQWLDSRQLTVELRGTPERVVTGLATLPEAGPDQLSFLANPQYRRYLGDTQAGAVLLSEKDAEG